MSKVTDFAAHEQSNEDKLNAKLDDIVKGVGALDTLITTLKNTTIGLTPEEQAALDAVTASSDALVAKAAAISTDAPVDTPPPVV